MDADEDGKVDALVTDAFGILSFYHGNGDGAFSSDPNFFGIGDVPYGIGAADLNGDGHLDVIISGVNVGGGAYGGSAGNLVSVLLGDGAGSFSSPRVYRGDISAFTLAIADFNGDGHPDVVTANQDSDSAVLFINNGTGGFGDPQGNWIGYPEGGAVNAPMSGLISSDVNGDGFPDLALMEWNVLTSSYYQLTVLLNDGTGHFSDPVRSNAIDINVSSNFGDFVLADFRNSGHPDFLAIGLDPIYSTPPFLAFAANSGSGQFGPLKTTTPAGAQGVIGVGDFNGDGKLDFVAASSALSSVNTTTCNMFLGNGDGTFRRGASQAFGGNVFRSPAAAYVEDFNRDGRSDLIVFLEDNTGWTLNDDLFELLGNGDGTFQPARLLFSHFGPMTVMDVNRDGHGDLIQSSFRWTADEQPLPAKFSLYLNQPGGSFLPKSTYSYPIPNAIPQFSYPTLAAEHYAPMLADLTEMASWI